MIHINIATAAPNTLNPLALKFVNEPKKTKTSGNDDNITNKNPKYLLSISILLLLKMHNIFRIIHPHLAG